MSVVSQTVDGVRERVRSMPLDAIDPSDAQLYEDDTIHHYFERLRAEDPVHRSHSPLYGDYWSITRYQDIMTVDSNHAAFSSDINLGGISIIERPVQ